jgi:hypothetical protein
MLTLSSWHNEKQETDQNPGNPLLLTPRSESGACLMAPALVNEGMYRMFDGYSHKARPAGHPCMSCRAGSIRQIEWLTRCPPRPIRSLGFLPLVS